MIRDFLFILFRIWNIMFTIYIGLIRLYPHPEYFCFEMRHFKALSSLSNLQLFD